MLGVLQNHEALRNGLEQNLDLVEVNPKAEPPVCKILDFESTSTRRRRSRRRRGATKAVVEIKEVKLRPKTDDHDIDFKGEGRRGDSSKAATR